MRSPSCRISSLSISLLPTVMSTRDTGKSFHHSDFACSGVLYSSTFDPPRYASDHCLSNLASSMSFVALLLIELAVWSKLTQGEMRSSPFNFVGWGSAGRLVWGWIKWEIRLSVRFPPAESPPKIIWVCSANNDGIYSSNNRYIAYLRVFLPFDVDEILQSQDSLLNCSWINGTWSQILHCREYLRSMCLLNLLLTILDEQHR